MSAPQRGPNLEKDKGFLRRNESGAARLIRGSVPEFVACQRKRPLAIGVKAPYPGFIEPALATSIEGPSRRTLDP
jgi:hypothetical protein